VLKKWIAVLRLMRGRYMLDWIFGPSSRMVTGVGDLE